MPENVNVTSDLIKSHSKTVMKCVVSNKVNVHKVYNKIDQIVSRNDVKLKCGTLKHIDAEIAGNGNLSHVQVSALIDSQTEMTVISHKLLEGMKLHEVGHIDIQGVLVNLLLLNWLI